MHDSEEDKDEDDDEDNGEEDVRAFDELLLAAVVEHPDT